MSQEDLTSYAIHDPQAYTHLLQEIQRVQENTSKRLYFEFFLTIASYYHSERLQDPGALLRGRQAMEWVLLIGSVQDDRYFNTTLRNAQFFIQQLPGIRETLLPTTNQIGGYQDPLWKALNPFIISIPPYEDSNQEEFLYGLRMTDFDKKGNHYFSSHGYTQICNYYELIDHQGTHHILQKDYEYPRHPSYYSEKVDGLEDLRGCWTPHGIRLIGVTPDAHAQPGPRMSMVTLKGNSLCDLRPLHGDPVDNSTAQKNWLPYWEDDQLKVIYSSDPLTLLQVQEDGICTLLHRGTQRIPGARGGSPPVPWAQIDGSTLWLYSLHFVGIINGQRAYYHRFVKMLRNRIVDVSQLFYLDQKCTIEYISGAGVQNDILSIAYGSDDKEAKLARLTRQEVEWTFDLTFFKGTGSN